MAKEMKAEARPVALVTGSSSGFGLLASISLARAGHRVFSSMRNLSRATKLSEAAAQAHVELETVLLDVTEEASIRAAVTEVHERAGRIDVLVNNAGFAMGGWFEDLALSELREQFETNFFGLAAVTKAVLPDMRARKSGRIINLASIAGLLGAPGLSAYCASKWAVEGLMESLRFEASPHGVHVVLVEPGLFKTEIFGTNKRLAVRSRDPESPNYEATQRYQAMIERMWQKTTRDPQDVADLIVHAATVEKPHLRYLVGGDAKARAMAKRFLPFGVLELAVQKYLGARMR